MMERKDFVYTEVWKEEVRNERKGEGMEGKRGKDETAKGVGMVKGRAIKKGRGGSEYQAKGKLFFLPKLHLLTRWQRSLEDELSIDILDALSE